MRGQLESVGIILGENGLRVGGDEVVGREYHGQVAHQAQGAIVSGMVMGVCRSPSFVLTWTTVDLEDFMLSVET